MRYEIINPSDKCYIYADDVQLAKVACALLGSGWYGLKDEDDEPVMHILESLDDALGMSEQELLLFIDNNKKELVKVLRSFEYESERTSMTDIGARAAMFANALDKEEST